MRISTGRGTSPSPSRQGATEGVTTAFAAYFHGAASIRSSNARRCGSAIAANGTGGKAPSSAGRMHHASGSQPATDVRATLSPSQTVRHAGQRKVLAEQPRRKVGQEGRQGRRFDQTAAGIVDDSHAIARGGEQAGHAGAVGVEFQRIDHAAAQRRATAR